MLKTTGVRRTIDTHAWKDSASMEGGTLREADLFGREGRGLSCNAKKMAGTKSMEEEVLMKSIWL